MTADEIMERLPYGMQMSPDDIEKLCCLACEIRRLRGELGNSNKKWRDYEQEYILPVFDLMTEAGVDLRELVREFAGTNCVILAVKQLRAQRDVALDRVRDLEERVNHPIPKGWGLCGVWRSPRLKHTGLNGRLAWPSSGTCTYQGV